MYCLRFVLFVLKISRYLCLAYRHVCTIVYGVLKYLKVRIADTIVAFTFYFHGLVKTCINIYVYETLDPGTHGPIKTHGP